MKCIRCGKEIYAGQEFVMIWKDEKSAGILCLDCDEEDQEEGAGNEND